MGRAGYAGVIFARMGMMTVFVGLVQVGGAAIADWRKVVVGPERDVVSVVIAMLEAICTEEG